MCATWLKRRASSATPTSDWLITAVGPPPWATSIFPDAIELSFGLLGWVNLNCEIVPLLCCGNSKALFTSESKPVLIWRIRRAFDLAQAFAKRLADN